MLGGISVCYFTVTSACASSLKQSVMAFQSWVADDAVKGFQICCRGFEKPADNPEKRVMFLGSAIPQRRACLGAQPLQQAGIHQTVGDANGLVREVPGGALVERVEVSLERRLGTRYQGAVQLFLRRRAPARDLGRAGANFAVLSGIQLNERLFWTHGEAR